MPVSARPLLILAAAFIALPTPAEQPTATPLTFEVASIKPTARTDGHWRLEPTPDGYTGDDISLLKLVGEAYGVFDPKLLTGGPPWVDRDKFDLEAKFDTAAIPDAKSLTYRQRADMLQPLLAERFHLKVHFETREFPVYNLVIAKDGPKLKESSPEHMTEKAVGGVTCLTSREGYQGCSVGILLMTLRYAAGRTVVDKTGLTGHYDFTLSYSSADTPPDSTDAAYPTIFTALQEQLGLKLEPSTAPLSILVIDSAEKPSPN